MKPPQTWLEKAWNKLSAAKELLLDTDPALDIVLQYTHESAAKALKAFLNSQGQSFDDSNDLVELIEQCAELDPTFSTLSDPAEDLTVYGIIFRNPEGAEIIPEKSEAAEAVRLAEVVLEFVAAKIN